MSAQKRIVPLEDAAIVVDPRDDVAVARRHLAAGTALAHQGAVLMLSGEVHAKHKFALVPLPAGRPVRMYGAVAGAAARDIAPGDPLTLENVTDRVTESAAPAGLGGGGAAAGGVPALPKSQSGSDQTDRSDPPERCEAAGHRAGSGVPLPPGVGPQALPTFQGIDRGQGGVGTRNHLLVVYTVPCAATVAGRITAACRSAYGFEPGDPYARYARERLGTAGPAAPAPEALFPGVDDIVILNHQSGCGMPDHGDLEAVLRWMAGYIRNPNVGGALVLGLGCEKADVEWFEREHLDAIRRETGKPVRTLSHQALGTEDALVRAGIDHVHEILTGIAGIQRTPMPLSRLVLGTKCGGSDGFSGISANPALGWVSDHVAAAGGTVLLPEVPEMFGAEGVLASRAVTPAVAEQVYALLERYVALAARSQATVNENPSQGNISDGLLTIQMKSLGAIRKAGTGPVAGVLEYAGRPQGGGVYLLDSPGYDVLSTAALPASGANVICFTTGLGTPFGNPIVPAIKISSNTRLAERMPDIIDFDAGTVIAGAETLEECGARLLETILAVASGRRTRNEENDHRESAFWQRQVNL